ncbi:MAG: hypothetical protein QNK36_02490 [Colwellia sp.]|nr:hypothetical protein [Colwellia sp.]
MTKLLTRNLNTASRLITSFKHAAVDQTSDEIRLIVVSKYMLPINT